MLTLLLAQAVAVMGASDASPIIGAIVAGLFLTVNTVLTIVLTKRPERQEKRIREEVEQDERHPEHARKVPKAGGSRPKKSPRS